MLLGAHPGDSHSVMDAQARKSAKQRRSRGTVEALLEATARVVEQVGLDQATTNRIAEVAGVSVGSLYQYFPGKAALLAAVIEREAEKDLAVLARFFDPESDAPLAELIERAARELVARHSRSPRLYRWMLRYVPELGQHEKVRGVAARGRALLRDLLGARRGELAVDVEPALAALVLGSALEAAVHAALFERPESLQDGSLERTLTRLARRYLLDEAVDGASAAARQAPL